MGVVSEDDYARLTAKMVPSPVPADRSAFLMHPDEINGRHRAYIFSAVRPDTGDDVTLVMPSVNAKVMDLFLAHFADTLDQDAHAVMMCDGAGWHDERALTVPDNVTLALLPPYSPELNPVERVWLYLRERFLSLRVLDDTEAIIDACCQAWIDLIAEPDRMRTLCAYPWIMKVIS